MSSEPMILVVDDDHARSSELARLLAAGGLRVALARDGAEALRAVREQRPALMLLGVRLKDMSGVDVLREVRSDPSLADVAVVLFSAEATAAEEPAAGLDAGADGYIPLPVSGRELIARMRSKLRQRDLAQRLRVSERRSRRLIESQADAVIVVDATGRIRLANVAAQALLGLADGEPADARFPLAVGASESPEMMAIIRPGGEPVAVEMRVSETTWEDEPAYIASLRDIGERERALEALRASEQRYRDIVDNSQDIIFINRNNSIIYINPAGVRLLRARTADDLIGRPPLELVHPGFQAIVRERVARLLEGPCAVPPITQRLVALDGSVIDVEAFGVSFESGNHLDIQVVCRDITSRLLAEQRLAQQAALLDAANEAIVVEDLQGRIVFWNKGAEHVFGWPAAAALDRSAAEFLGTSEQAEAAARQAALEQGQWRGILVRKTSAGTTREIEVGLTLVRDAQGEPQSILVISSDATDRRRLEAQYLRAQRMESIGTLAGGIAHDLNNVLTPVLMAVDLLRVDEADKDRNEILASMEASVQRGAAMIRQLLTFARGLDGEPVMVDLVRVAREVRAIVQDTFPKNILVELTAPRDAWPVLADPTQLHQVMMNLCVNARDAMPRGGRLGISIENEVIDDVHAGLSLHAQPGPHAVLQVSDSGTGILAEDQEHIFEPFFTTKEPGKGTGLGLSTVHAIVRGMGGFVHVYSESGRGTRFKVYLPAVATLSQTESVAVERTQLPRGSGELVLVVDDESSVRNVARRTLERFGYRVALAAHGAEAVSIFARRQAEISVVLTDMSMPVMDGPATIVALRAIDPGIRIIASSGLATEQHGAKAMAAGVRHFVPKPYTADALLTTIHAILHETTP